MLLPVAPVPSTVLAVASAAVLGSGGRSGTALPPALTTAVLASMAA